MPASHKPPKGGSQAQAQTNQSIFLARKEVAAKLKVSQRTVDYFVQIGSLPQPVRFSARTVRWPRAQIEALAGSADKGGSHE